ncbi:MAG: putative unusual protein kinase regulating ubiquinone biosynthesis (AarF/ABC1/UbiB family) [Myxococcota bacterium]|jgi:predicted unusual protein kinase regulating ubiquinone biosynthesis (AarF/ABC1/UbiB family)
MAKPPRSKMSRLARLGGLTSRVSGSYLGQRIKGAFQDEEGRAASMRKTHLENAERVVATMGSLKGAAMKVGQSLAQVVEGMDLPPEMASILSQLNDKAEPVPFPLIRASVESELEGTLAERFAAFDEEPLGTASLAQAHAARLPDGTPVVVKVLHEGIEDSVGSDLGALKSLLITSRMLKRDRSEIDDIFAELHDRLEEELDYYREAANLEEFHRSMAGINGVSIPKTHPKWCTGRILTMDRLTGRPMTEFLKIATPEAKTRAGNLLAESFHDMFYRQRALHADPHAGNYLFRSDGGVGILDFGCVKRFDLYWTGQYARMAQAIVDARQADFYPLARGLEILGPGTPESESVLWRLSQTVCYPLTQSSYRCGTPEDNVMMEVRRQVPGVLRHPNLRSPREIVFLHRALGGIYNMLRLLGHEMNYSAMFRRYTDHAIAVAEGRVEDFSPVA